MIVYYIKLTCILALFISCIICTYTDIRYLIIPNRITFSMILLGLVMSTAYFVYIQEYIELLFYYLTVILVYIINYFLWRLGVWAGGDVKLFTAISCLFVDDYLSVIPSLCNLSFPLFRGEFFIPSFELMANSIFSIVPIIVLIVLYEIIKNKRYLIDKVRSCIAFNESFILINSLTMCIVINNMLNIDNVIINLLILGFLSFIINRISEKSKLINITISVIILIYSAIKMQLPNYLIKFILIITVLSMINILKSGLLKEALSRKISTDSLEEGMILTYNLCYDGNKYYFNKKGLMDRINLDEEVVVDSLAHGVSVEDVDLIRKLVSEDKLDDDIYVKKSMSFAPFILMGLVVTCTIGSSYLAFIRVLGGLL